ncbi:MAG: hypothetical protein CR967_01255 [Proteobacteria bacterium]|nr:MAG: hypothetical protein CR967_01255 [Pseudomonadota bacterium]
MRKLLVHYHIFKNAGSSVDRLLQTSFQNRWCKFDDYKNPSYKISPNELFDFLNSRPDVLACSSHQARIGKNQNQNKYNIHIFPIIFLRHPIDRTISAYNFEWKIQKKLDRHQGTLAEYLELKFSEEKNSAVENYQTYYLANQFLDKVQSNLIYADDTKYLDYAIDALNDLKCFGLVEHYNESVDNYYSYLHRDFPMFKKIVSKENISQDNSSIDIKLKLKSIRNRFGENIYYHIKSKNIMDIELYYYAKDLFFKNKFAYSTHIPYSLNKSFEDISVEHLLNKSKYFDKDTYMELNKLPISVNPNNHFAQIGFFHKKVFSLQNNYKDLFLEFINIHNSKISTSSNNVVVIHIYYEEYIDEFLTLIEQYPDIDFIFTVVFSITTYSLAKLLVSKYRIFIFENMGRDVYPFLKILPFLFECNYKNVCKLHGKKSIKFVPIEKFNFIKNGDQWRVDLISKLLGNKKIVKENIGLLNEQDISMLIPKKYALPYKEFKGRNKEKVKDLLSKIDIAYHEDFIFSAGTMFWCKMEILRPLLKLDVKKMFEKEGGEIDGTDAHALERIFGMLAKNSDAEVKQI